MNAHAPVTEDTAVSFVVEPQTPLSVLKDPAQAEALFKQIREQIDIFTPDLTTVSGRKAINSFAFKITKTRTAVDAARKAATEEWRKLTDSVNGAGRTIKARLEALEEEARRPLTEWEAAEDRRVQTVADWFTAAERAVVILNDDTAAAVAERLASYEGMELSEGVFGDSLGRAQATRTVTISALQAAHERLLKSEADAAELARLRAESEAREAEKRAAQEAEDAKVAEANRAEQQAEAERLAEERGRLAAQQQQQEQDRLERLAEEARERDRTHRSKVMGAAKLALIGCGITEEQAKEVVKAIAADKIPNISIKF